MLNIQIYNGTRKKLINLNLDVQHTDTIWHYFYTYAQNLGLEESDFIQSGSSTFGFTRFIISLLQTPKS